MSTHLTKTGLLFPDSSYQPGTQNRLKNRIINGRMAIDQLNLGQPIPMSVYSTARSVKAIDRWICLSTGVVTLNGNTTQEWYQVDSPITIPYSTTTWPHWRNFLRFTVGTNSYGGATQLVGFAQRIESIYCDDLQWSDITIRANLRSSVATTAYWALYYPNSRDTYVDADILGTPVHSGCSLFASGTWSNINDTFQTKTAKVSLTSAPASGLMLVITVGYNSPAVGTTFDLTDVQLEKGGDDENYGVLENRSVMEELELCRRYMQITNYPRVDTYQSYVWKYRLDCSNCWYEHYGDVSSPGRLYLKWDLSTPMRWKTYPQIVNRIQVSPEVSPGTGKIQVYCNSLDGTTFYTARYTISVNISSLEKHTYSVHQSQESQQSYTSLTFRAYDSEFLSQSTPTANRSEAAGRSFSQVDFSMPNAYYTTTVMAGDGPTSTAFGFSTEL